MDPTFAKAAAEVFGPVLGVLACGAIPVALVFISKHFKLRMRELELEAQLHSRDAQARLQALETRIAAMEAGLGSLVQTFARRPELAPPDAPAAQQPALPGANVEQLFRDPAR